MQINPLLTEHAFPPFDVVKPEHVVPGMTTLLGQVRDQLQALLENPGNDWSSTVVALRSCLRPLDRAWSYVNHLCSVCDEQKLRDAYNQVLPKITDFYTQLGQNQALYKMYQRLSKDKTLNAEQKQVVKHALRDFMLAGVHLPKDQREQLATWAAQKAELSQTFSEHVMDATDDWGYLTQDKEELDGLPLRDIESARQAAQAQKKQGFLLTLQYPSYLAVMTYAKSRALREKVYRAFVGRASDLDAYDNRQVMHDLLQLRQQQAQLLGYDHYTAYSVVPKMAKTPQEVQNFLNQLASKAKPYAQKEWDALRTFAGEKLKLKELWPWDIAFVSEQMRQSEFHFSQEQIKAYFVADKVLKGLFELVHTLYGITLVRDYTLPVWHEDVQVYRAEDASGQAMAWLYMDLYARTHKRAGAWMDVFHTRDHSAKRGQYALATVVCNFSAPLQGGVSTLTHDDVMTLFHELGHALHHMLSTVDEPEVAGIEGVEWDAVELPSQLMENFCWDQTILASLSAHVETGKPLPLHLFEKMLSAKHFQSGLALLRQIALAQVDWTLHTARQHSDHTQKNQDVLIHANQAYNNTHFLPQPDCARLPHQFSHIFAGGYASGYYSYLWAEVLSSDVFACFEDYAQKHGAPIANPVMGKRFYDEVLSVGSSRDAGTSCKVFLGRAPNIDALFIHRGLF